LKAVSGVSAVSAGVVGFRLAPRLNAGGRLADAIRSVDLLTTDDEATAKRLAAELNDENQARQVIEREILDDAIAQVERDERLAERRSLVLASREWHQGVIGIVATRLVERYYRPTVLIAIDAETGVARGSGRSISGFNLYEALKACAPLLQTFGGHRVAAGLSIQEEQIGDFQNAFEEHVRSNTTAEDFTPVTLIDSELDFGDIDDGLLADLDKLEPHGAGNPQPMFLARDVTVLSKRIVGENHLKLFLRQGNRALSAIAFGRADAAVESGSRLDILFSPEHNEWNGSSTIQLRIADLRPRQ
jgi:single-stranded-DNA-specific exonuclease